MKYKLLRFSLLSMLVMLFGGLAHAADPEVTLDFTKQSNWDIPTSGTNTNRASFTDGTNTIFLYATSNYKLNNGYLILGKKDSYLELPAFDFDVEKIEIEGTSGASASVKQNIYVGETAVSTETTGAKDVINAYEIADAYQAAGNVYKLMVTSAHNTQIANIHIYKKGTGGQTDTRVATTLTLAEGYATTGEVGGRIALPRVTVTDANGSVLENATVTWESSNTEVATINAVENTISLVAAGKTTITASYAGDETNYKSSKASFTLTVKEYVVYTTIASMLENITTTKTDIKYTFDNLLVTYVNGSNTYVNDGQNNMLLYGTELGLKAGDIIRGSICGQLYKYNSLPEIAVKASDIQVTVASSGNEVTPTVIEISAIENNLNNYVVIENAEYVSANSKDLTFKVGETEFIARNNWSVDVTALEAGKVYTLTGIGSVYNTTYQLYLISFEEKTAQEPEQWAWVDIKADFTNQSFFTEADANGATAGLKMNADDTFTRVAADDATANAVISGKWHSKEHGISNFSATVKVEGPVKIILGTCAWGGNVTVKNAEGTEVVPSFTTNTGACYHQDMAKNVVSAYYTGEATTLTIAGGSYVPFFAVLKVNAEDIPHTAKITFSLGESSVEGVLPDAIEKNIGEKVKIPANTTLYAEGKTLTAWTDGTNQYKAGDEITLAEDITLTPIFTANEATFADRTAEVTAIWDFQQKNGAPVLNYQNKTGFYVTQIVVNEKTIDFRLDFDTNNGGKIANGSWQDWCQINSGTKFVLPAYKGTTYSTFSMNDNSNTTFNGETGTYANYENTYTFNGSSDEMTIDIQGGSYYRWVKAVYPVPTQDAGGFVDIKADFTNQSFLTDEEKAGIADESNKNPSLNFGLSIGEDGSATRVASDAENANAVISGKWHSNEHGISNFSATVKVEGTVKITFGTCAWGGDVEVKNAEGVVVATMNTNTGACYHGDKTANVVSCYYKQDAATTLTISGGSYVPYFAVEKVDPKDIPSDVEFIFDITESGAEGVAPAEEIAGIGKKYTLPKNFTLYKEGSTLTGWTDGTNTYAPGEEITAPDAESITLTPVFTENTVSLADRTEPVTLKYNFRRDAGAPTVAYQNATGIWVAQATIGDKVIDVKANFDTNNGGKFANGNWNDWAQLNSGTKWTIPSCKGATVSMEAYSDITTTTIDGQIDYTQGKTISYEIAGAAESVDVVIGDGSYYRYIQVVLPVVQSQGGGKSFDNAEGTITWVVGNEASGTVSENLTDAFTSISGSIGSGLNATTKTVFDQTMLALKPSTDNPGNDVNNMIEFRVKAAAGLTFKPTSVTYDAVKNGTDNASYSYSYVIDGVESTITTVSKDEIIRNNNTTGTPAMNHSVTISNEGCSEFAFRIYVSGFAAKKDLDIANIIINGIVNGETVNVNMYKLTAVVSPEEAGSINIYPAAEQYEEGSEVTLTATENFGYDFVNWTNAAGDEVSTEAKFKYTINANETLTANFKAVETYELALTVDGTNDYMVTINPAPTMVEGKMMYEAGTAVELNANQYEGLVTFANWSDGETASNKIVRMVDNVTLTAVYAQADIIAGWDFYKAGANGRKADFAGADNDADALNLVNTTTGETSGWLDKSTEAAGGYESFKGAAVNWQKGTKNGDVGYWHWQTKVNAEAFTNITVQFQMLYNYNAYQKYNAEYSLDGENWTNFGSITMGGAKAPASFNETLPEAANNQKDLFIRMIADKTSNVDGTASANDGNTLAMFFITGTPKLVDDGVAPVLVSTVPANNATSASATGKIVLTFDEKVKIAEGTVAMLGSQELTPAVSGKVITFQYKGLEYAKEYTFTLAANTVADMTDNFLAEPITLTFTTMERPAIQKGNYDAVVENVDQLMAAITAAESRSDKNVRYRIFIKNGEYTIPLKETTKSGAEMPDGSGNRFQIPECITFIKSGNISFIGESRDGVIITNGIDKNETFAGKYGTTSKYDGIGNSDVFQISGNDYYFQDLTVETGMDDATGRDLAIQDKATRTIYKNTGLRGYQDTWTSNNDRGLYYFEGGYVRGRTDYMCGKGDAFFNGVELRQIAGGYAAVPSKPAKIGWVYKDCVINGEAATVNYATGETRTAAQADGNYTLGRPWGSGTPVALFIDTKMNVVPSAIGWNEMSGGWPARFAEYNSTTSTGSVIDLSGRKKTFGDGHENNPVLSAEEALEYSDMSLMFGEWQPTLATEQAPIPSNVRQEGRKLIWDDSNYALLWAVCKDGSIIGFTTEPEFDVTEDGKYTVRAANEMGGLSEASAEATIATGIETVETVQPVVDDNVYTLQGVRVDKARKGLYIIGGRKVVIK